MSKKLCKWARSELKSAIPFSLIACLFVMAFSVRVAAQKEESKESKRSWKEYFMGRWKSRPANESGRHSPEEFETLSPEGIVDLIDSQTANVIDYGGFRLNFRFYSEGGILSHISFGVFQRLNIGASWDLEDFVGFDSPSTNVPTLNAKFRVYDGGVFLPSLAIGFDGQGRFFNDAKDEYDERERGLYIVMAREIVLPNLELYAGSNIAEFKDAKFKGSVGLSYAIERKLVLMTEYDNIRVARENRWNAGFRVFPLSSLAIDFAVRRIASNKKKERIIRINYVGSF